MISVLLCASLGRSCRDRGAELLDGLLARVAGTRAAGKYDLDVGNADKAEDLAKVPPDVSGRRTRSSLPTRRRGRCRARDQQGQRSQDLDQSGDDPKPLADSDLVEYLPLPD